MDQLCETIEHVHQSNKNSVLWIGGDLNLPDINWNSTSIKGNKVNSCISKRLLDMIHNCHMEQTVTFPTRLDNTLDLFLTNRPSLINRCSPLPGISDHDAVFIETSAAAKRGKPVKRKIHLWKRADNEKLKKECLEFQQQFLDKYTIQSSIAEMWLDISTALTNILDSSVPSKMTTSRFSQPWITKEIKALSRRKKRCFNRVKSSNRSRDKKNSNIKRTQPTIPCSIRKNAAIPVLVLPRRHQIMEQSATNYCSLQLN
ncbi:Hypothetical predicted protein [Mytilus galloprovincialis]|uniref:Endonuclease/exonuclease/phosphatase domain-containing protein n=1 Tax=Mytilus galloprovincialis TaxID=29158 RepID=A0A8B6DYF8_MYTGA|nr:Hypothetical predicted protein [Mytilus galloprovincialis]